MHGQNLRFVQGVAAKALGSQMKSGGRNRARTLDQLIERSWNIQWFQWPVSDSPANVSDGAVDVPTLWQPETMMVGVNSR